MILLKRNTIIILILKLINIIIKIIKIDDKNIKDVINNTIIVTII